MFLFVLYLTCFSFFCWAEKQPAPVEQTFSKKNARFFEKLSQTVLHETPSTKNNKEDKELQSIAFLQIQKNIEQKPAEQRISNKDTVNNLHILDGNFFKSINTKTLIGKATLVKNLLFPTNNKDILTARQDLFKYLAQHPELVEKLDNLLTDIKKYESSILELDIKTNQYLQEKINNVYSWSMNTESESLLGLLLSGKAIILPSFDLLRQAINFHINLMSGEILSNYYETSVTKVPENSLIVDLLVLCIKYTLVGRQLFNLVSLPSAFFGSKHLFNTVQYMQDKMIQLATYKKKLEEIKLLIAENPLLAQCCSDESLYHFLVPKDDETTQELMQKFDAPTFQGEPSLFSRHGVTLRQYKKVINKEGPIKEAFLKIHADIGILDMMLAVFQKTQPGLPGSEYVFTQYLANESQPVIQAYNFKNPNIEQSVGNDFVLGNNGFHKDVVITGPNRCGKSTLAKTILFNVLLSQTLGIANATKFIITLFDRIRCIANISDTQDESLFQAEAKKLGKQFDYEEQYPHEKSFLIIDEGLRGSKAEKLQAMLVRVADERKKYKKAAHVFVTHYPALNKLCGYTSYYVDAKRQSDGSLKPTYKIYPGFSDEEDIEHILKKYGVIRKKTSVKKEKNDHYKSWLYFMAS